MEVEIQQMRFIDAPDPLGQETGAVKQANDLSR